MGSTSSRSTRQTGVVVVEFEALDHVLVSFQTLFLREEIASTEESARNTETLSLS